MMQTILSTPSKEAKRETVVNARDVDSVGDVEKWGTPGESAQCSLNVWVRDSNRAVL